MDLLYKKKKVNFKIFFINLLLVFILIELIISPEIYMASILNGVLLWSKAVLPALFPFFFLTKMLTELGSVQYIAIYFEKLTQKLFKVKGIASYAFIMSIFSGYPVGAKITSELYENGYISLKDMHKLCTFCSTSGPLFIIGTVGVGMLQSKTAGIIILVCHIVGAILNGVLWRNYSLKIDDKIENWRAIETRIKDNLLSYSVSNSVFSIAVVGGYIALFCMFVDIGINTGLFGALSMIISYPFNFMGLDSDYCLAFITGIVEITRGSLEVSKIALDYDFMIVLITILISFGGISTHLQSLSFLGKHKLNYSFFLISKITQAIISGAIAWLIMLIL